MPLPPATVVVDLPHWQALQPPEVAELREVVAQRREVVVTAEDGGLTATVRWWLVPLGGPARLEGSIASGLDVTGASFDAVAAPILPSGDLSLQVNAPGVLELTGRLRGERLTLLPAATGTVALPSGLRPRGDGYAPIDAGYAGSSQTLELDRALATPPVGDLLVASTGLGLTVHDDSATWRARVHLAALRGDVRRLTVTVPGVPDGIRLTGPGDSQRAGDSFTLEVDPTAAVDAELSWTVPLEGEEGRLTVPTVHASGALRQQVALQVARVGDSEVLPDLPGATAISARALEPWARDLVDGTTTAVFSGVRGGAITVTRYAPLPGPPVMVDVADWSVMATREGRTLVRGLLDVRNDRAGYLRITPPDDAHLLSLLVDQMPTAPVSDGEAGLLVPLPRSVEAVEGLLSFPIEAVWIVDAPTRWGHRRSVPLPAIGAEVAVSQTTVTLPHGWHAPHTLRGDEVESFHAGQSITYGLAHAETAALADARYRAAVGAWLDNDFSRAQENLDALAEMGANNDNVTLLQQNLYVVSGDGEADDAASRRIKDQARARAFEEEIEARDALAEAGEALASGDVDKAKKKYEVAWSIGERLSKLDQSEQVALQEVEAEAAEGLLAVEEAAASAISEAQGTQGIVLSRDMLQKIPAGRSYEDAVTMSAGVIGYSNDGESFEPAAMEPAREPVDTKEGDLVGGVFDLDQPVQDASVSQVIVTESTTFLPRIEASRTYNAEVTDVIAISSGVEAASGSVIVPTRTGAVRFEHLVVPAGATLTVDVRSLRTPEVP